MKDRRATFDASPKCCNGNPHHPRSGDRALPSFVIMLAREGGSK